MRGMAIQGVLGVDGNAQHFFMMDDVELQDWLSDDEQALFSGAMIPVLRELALARQAMVVLALVTDGQPTGSIKVFEAKHVVERWQKDVEDIHPPGWNVYQRVQDELQRLRDAEVENRKRLQLPHNPKRKSRIGRVIG